ncbi:MAG: putative methyltransferase [Gammaproteobacteria bacterium]|nr:MAG: putative methyltransferase [Gammaproteobacteria bacterium]TND03249.1 MAG: putative methyltransferase [Gammaproteobacteria bacterium]
MAKKDDGDTKVTRMSHGTINSLLKKMIGLDVSTIGQGSIKRAIDHRLRQTGIPDAESYLTTLNSSEQELRALIEEVVVPETWFFRDQGPFDALRMYAEGVWMPAHPGGTLRVLSLPCSTGEEPYTIGMVFTDCGLPPARARIDAIDVSSSALAKAKRAIYTKNSFRNPDTSFRDKYFRQTEQGYELDSAVSTMVRFAQGNILSNSFVVSREPYDVIFCRNLFIYFDRETQRNVVRKLYSLLKTNGLLFVGHSEASIIPRDYFQPLEGRGSFGYRKRDLMQVIEDRCSTIQVDPSKDRLSERAAQQQLPLRVKAELPIPVAAPLAASVDDVPLQRAYKLANEGFLDEAATLCEARLKADEACVDAYFLLGVVREALGDHKSAGELFRKALYLDQNHYEALIHLALQAEAEGNRAAADVLKQRAERAARAKSGDQDGGTRYE